MPIPPNTLSLLPVNFVYRSTETRVRSSRSLSHDSDIAYVAFEDVIYFSKVVTFSLMLPYARHV